MTRSRRRPVQRCPAAARRAVPARRQADAPRRTSSETGQLAVGETDCAPPRVDARWMRRRAGRSASARSPAAWQEHAPPASLSRENWARCRTASRCRVRSARRCPVRRGGGTSNRLRSAAVGGTRSAAPRGARRLSRHGQRKERRAARRQPGDRAHVGAAGTVQVLAGNPRAPKEPGERCTVAAASRDQSGDAGAPSSAAASSRVTTGSRSGWRRD